MKRNVIFTVSMILLATVSVPITLQSVSALGNATYTTTWQGDAFEGTITGVGGFFDVNTVNWDAIPLGPYPEYWVHTATKSQDNSNYCEVGLDVVWSPTFGWRTKYFMAVRDDGVTQLAIVGHYCYGGAEDVAISGVKTGDKIWTLYVDYVAKGSYTYEEDWEGFYIYHQTEGYQIPSTGQYGDTIAYVDIYYKPDDDWSSCDVNTMSENWSGDVEQCGGDGYGYSRIIR